MPDAGASHADTHQAVDEPADDPALDIREVGRLTGLSKGTIKRRVADGSFPVPLKLSAPGELAGQWRRSDNE